MQMHAAQTIRPTILVVEDDCDFREMIKLILFDAGYRILEAASEPDAISMWNKNPFQIDLLITDVCIPYRSTGVELARKLRAQKPDLRVIYTSGFGIELLQSEMIVAQDFYFLPKPFAPVQLLETICHCFGTEVRPPLPFIIGA